MQLLEDPLGVVLLESSSIKTMSPSRNGAAIGRS